MINLSVLGDALAGSELYGHEAGAFTGARCKRHGRIRSAQGGTLVIDELTKAPAYVQHHLLDLLDGKPFYPVGSDREVHLDVRIVALTSTPLEVAAKTGALVPDLFERLRTTVVRIADLNSRTDDVLSVVHTALPRWSTRFGYKTIPELSPDLAEALTQARWPGNHRQVDGLVQRLLANAQGSKVIMMAHLPIEEASLDRRGARERFLDDYRAGVTLAHAGPSEASKHYGVDRATIRRWVREEQTRGLEEP
jgi:DNA-binding NtrC family response regulator